MSKERLASLISGGGTTMREIALRCQSGDIPMDMACVIASKKTAGGIEKARELGIPEQDILIISPAEFREDGDINKEAFGEALLRELTKRDVTVIAQNGWLPLTPTNVINAFPDRIFNQHPGPVPDFGGKGMYGRRVHAAVLLYHRMMQTSPFTRVIAQRVAEKFDEGPVIEWEEVEILPTDTVEDLQERALPIEHTVQIRLLTKLAQGIELAEHPQFTLIKPWTEPTLELAKKMAKKLYPKG